MSIVRRVCAAFGVLTLSCMVTTATPAYALLGPVPTITVSDPANQPQWLQQYANMMQQINNQVQQIRALQTQVQQGVAQLAPLPGGRFSAWPTLFGSLSGILNADPGDKQQQDVAGEIGTSANEDASYLQYLSGLNGRVQGTTSAVQLNTLMQSAIATSLQKQTLLGAAGSASQSADQLRTAEMMTGFGDAPDPNTQPWSL